MKINSFVPDTKVFENMNIDKTSASADGTENSSESFLDVLKNQLDQVNDKQLKSEDITQSYIKGEGPSIDDVMVASSEAQMSLQLAVQVRNQLLNAVQEITKTQI